MIPFDSYVFRAAAATLLWSAVVTASAPQDQSTQYTPLNGYELVVDGTKDARARLYQAADRQSILIVPGNFGSAIVLRLITKNVETLDLGHLEEDPGTAAQVLAGYQASALGQYTAGSESVDFDFQGARLQIRLKPWLLKEHSSADLKAYDINYVQRSKLYQPDAALVSKIAAIDEPVEITVYFGSWCPFCQRNVPNLIKLEEVLKQSKVSFTYYGLPRDFGKEPLTETLQIHKIPTAVVRIGGKEVGRLVGYDCEKPEESLAKVLASHLSME